MLALWYFAAHLDRLKRLSADDWMMGAALIMTALFYTKFLSRADGHIYQSFTTGIPLFLLLIAKGLDWIEDAVSRTSIGSRLALATTRHSVTLLLVPVVLLVPPGSVLDLITHLP